MKMFIPITKVDVAKRMVYGRAAQSVLDKVGERMRYAESKPFFEEWSKNQFEASQGKSYGNIRAMHGKVAAGILAEPLRFDDTEQAIDVASKITDDQEWAKCQDGTYTGYSLGGSYVGERTTEKVDGVDTTWYTAKPAEISLVDSPCIPTARFFEIVKADGVVEKIAFKPAALEVSGTDEQVAEFAKLIQDSGKTMADVIAVLKVEFDPNKPQPVPKTEIEKAIESAMSIGMLRKRLDDPELLVEDFLKIAKEYDEPFPMLAASADLPALKARIIAKAGARHSAVDAAHLQEAHDHIASMGASCGKAAATDTGDLKKVVTALEEKVAKLESQPMPSVALRLVTKATENSGKVPDELAKLPYDQLVKYADGQIDWAASERAQATKGAAA